MITVIIASAKRDLFERIQKNVSETIGVPFEIIGFDNADGSLGLCALYNQGAAAAKYELLCYMHEDIHIETVDWGKVVLRIFEQNNPGVLGVAGSTYKSATPSAWFPPSEFGTASWRLNIKQGKKYQSGETKHDYYNPHDEKLSEVACLDGVWFCTTKTVVNKHPFDSDLLTGFHCYDLDFCLNVRLDKKIYVTYEVLMSHDSEGKFDKSWLADSIKVHQKWLRQLPINQHEFSTTKSARLEAASLRRFLNKFIKNPHFTTAEKWELLLFYRLRRKISLIKYLYLKIRFARYFLSLCLVKSLHIYQSLVEPTFT